MHAFHTLLDLAIGDRWQPSGAWTEDGARHVRRAIDADRGDVVCVTAVHCGRDGMATASLAREIGALESLAHHPGVVPLLASGRAAGGLYMVTPWLEGRSVADRHDRHAPDAALQAIRHVLSAADLLHFAHSLGIVHGAITADALCIVDEHACLRNFHRCARVRTDAHGTRAAAADTMALAAVLVEMLSGATWAAGRSMPEDLPDTLAGVLHRALGPNRDARFLSPIALAEALHGVVERGGHVVAEVSGRDADVDAAGDVSPIGEAAERSMRVLHALLDRAEVLELAPDEADPLVQRCWVRAEQDVAADDARLVALRCRWHLLADRDPVAAAEVSLPARHSPAVRPYRARALAALGQASEGRLLAVQAWFDDAALDLSALRSVSRALLLTRAFDLVSLVDVAGCAQGGMDPVMADAARLSAARGDMPVPDEPARVRALDAIACAIEARVPWTAELLVDPRWDTLRSDPRFTALLARAKTTWSRRARAFTHDTGAACDTP